MSSKPIAVFLLLTLLAAGSAGCGPEADPLRGKIDRYLVGAYYYIWFPKNFREGYLRQKLVPEQKLVLGRYASTDPAVAERHISWCSRYGIDFLAVSWWPRRDAQNAALDQGFMKAANLADIKFCIFYETWNLGFDSNYGVTRFDAAAVKQFTGQIVTLAKKYFGHPSYLKVDGRPVIIFYLSRTINVNYESAFANLRQKLRDLGFDAYFIGDEIFWKVAEAHGEWDESGPMPQPKATTEPQPERMRVFDAITSYNMYEGGKGYHAGYAGQKIHLNEVGDLYRRYSEAAGGARMVPQVIPGYNDRGVRLGVDHYVIPRQSESGETGHFFRLSLEELAFEFMDPELNMFIITSWNEWNEDTAVEPLEPTPLSDLDQSPSGRAYTQGFPYQGFSERYLEILQDKVVAVSGKVLDAQGRPVSGVEVGAWADGALLTTGRSNREGYYRLSRRRLPPGSYRIGAASQAERIVVEVLPESTVLGVDLAVEK